MKNVLFQLHFFFAGLVLGGIPLIYKGTKKQFNTKNIIILIIAIGIVVGMLFLPKTDKTSISGIDYFILFLCGIIASAFMIIPGVSGSMVLMLLGYYNTIINALGGLTSIDTLKSSILILIPFGIGVVIGFFGCAKLISFLLKKFPIQSYFGILGFVVASVVAIIYQSCKYSFDPIHLIVGIILIPVGFSITFIISKMDNKKTID